jgi:hypothetical protein
LGCIIIERKEITTIIIIKTVTMLKFLFLKNIDFIIHFNIIDRKK